MAVMLGSSAVDSEILALKLQEEELRVQQDALIAQRLAVWSACHADDQNDDVEFVMEVTAGAVAAAEEETTQLALVQNQLSEVQNRRSRMTVEDFHEVNRYQERVARCSRAVAQSLDEHERWRARVAQHDAAFARRLDIVDSDDWDDFGDEIEEPLRVPPPKSVPKVRDEPVPAAVYRASAEAAGCGGSSSTKTTSPSTAPQPTTTRTTTRPLTQQPSRPQAPPASGSGSRPPAAPTSSRWGTAGSSGPGDTTRRTTTTTTTAQPATARTAPLASGGPSATTSRWGPQAGAAASPPAAALAAAAARTATTKAGSSSAARGSGPSAATIECLCCFDRFPENDVTCAGADAASSSTASAGCGHYFCKSCTTEYIRGAVKDGKFPIGCPMVAAGGGAGGGGRAAPGGARQQPPQQQQRQGGCQLNFSRESVVAALQGHPKELQKFGLLEVEQTIEQSMRIYCPHKSCSTLLVRPEPGEMPKDTPISCPACQKMFCANCLITGWHHGYTCAAFQALPAYLRSAEDAAMLQLSERQQWKRCPSCKEMVERSEGCNHMKCRCGSAFCYACGKPYKGAEPTPENEHGTPACVCPLFDVPEDVEEDARQQPQPNYEGGGGGGGDGYGGGGGGGYGGGGGGYGGDGYGGDGYGGDGYGGGGYGGGGYDYGHPHPYVATVAPAPWRGGRVVKRRRCRFSDSIYNCQFGRKCWYWHEEDDGPL